MYAERSSIGMVRKFTLSTAAILTFAAAQAEATVLVRNDFSNMNDGLSFVGATNLDSSAVAPVQGHRADYASSGQYEQDSGAWVFSRKLQGNAGQSFSWGDGNSVGDAYDPDGPGPLGSTAIPGGVRVTGWLDGAAPGVITITVTAPEAITAGNAALTFSAAYKDAVTYGVGGTVQIRDITTGVDLLAPTTIHDHGFVLDGDGVTLWDFRKEWQFNNFTITGSAAAGDALAVIFTSNTAASSEGLSLTDITLQTVPEPTSLGLLGLGAVALLKRRRR